MPSNGRLSHNHQFELLYGNSKLNASNTDILIPIISNDYSIINIDSGKIKSICNEKEGHINISGSVNIESIINKDISNIVIPENSTVGQITNEKGGNIDVIGNSNIKSIVNYHGDVNIFGNSIIGEVFTNNLYMYGGHINNISETNYIKMVGTSTINYVHATKDLNLSGDISIDRISLSLNQKIIIDDDFTTKKNIRLSIDRCGPVRNQKILDIKNKEKISNIINSFKLDYKIFFIDQDGNIDIDNYYKPKTIV